MSLEGKPVGHLMVFERKQGMQQISAEFGSAQRAQQDEEGCIGQKNSDR